MAYIFIINVGKLRDLGVPLPSTTKEKIHLLWNMITDYTENFKNTIKGFS